jgi:SAM-dependent methyltransferase
LFSRRLAVIHFAPEPVFQQALRALPNLVYVSADLDSPLAAVRMDLAAIACPDGAFDVALCSHVLEHVADDRQALRELFRVLKPGGWSILQSPVDLNRETTFEDARVVSPADRARLFGQEDHVRLYGRDYAQRLEAAGFVVKAENFVKELPAEDIRRFGLVDEDIYLALKPTNTA